MSSRKVGLHLDVGDEEMIFKYATFEIQSHRGTHRTAMSSRCNQVVTTDFIPGRVRSIAVDRPMGPPPTITTRVMLNLTTVDLFRLNKIVGLAGLFGGVFCIPNSTVFRHIECPMLI